MVVYLLYIFAMELSSVCFVMQYRFSKVSEFYAPKSLSTVMETQDAPSMGHYDDCKA